MGAACASALCAPRRRRLRCVPAGGVFDCFGDPAERQPSPALPANPISEDTVPTALNNGWASLRSSLIRLRFTLNQVLPRGTRATLSCSLTGARFFLKHVSAAPVFNSWKSSLGPNARAPPLPAARAWQSSVVSDWWSRQRRQFIRVIVFIFALTYVGGK